MLLFHYLCECMLHSHTWFSILFIIYYSTVFWFATPAVKVGRTWLGGMVRRGKSPVGMNSQFTGADFS